MKITYYGHSCFLVETGGKRLLFDPFITGNPLAESIRAGEIRCDYILPTHAHPDHIGDLEAVAEQNPNALLVAIWEVSTYYSAKGLKTHPMNKGGWWTFDFGRLKMVQAVHSSVFPDGMPAGEPVGFVIDSQDGVLYVAGDTALTMDMQLIPMTCPTLDAAILPIGSNFTMDYADALIAADFIKCNRIIGCHYDTFGFIKIDHKEAKARFSENRKELILMEVGETTQI
ncbi:MAG: metal-dependent hydrolase [Saprospiraceae bacterium]|nr:metal-dependent hydrolase [Saprospiraceae bacterium]MCB0542386.1 metal-dependent hydrolase [Saprospiraceae bacterium]MCB0574652.1 metal-dependent hydrolase [Saprospiraceae bacterium]MCB9307627.1 metal-dependent hydrolase [Lewinellaceae bacterium]MCB9354507.1 metal-dependent hydrolase [Lewinellaceae bacterium]